MMCALRLMMLRCHACSVKVTLAAMLRCHACSVKVTLAARRRMAAYECFVQVIRVAVMKVVAYRNARITRVITLPLETMLGLDRPGALAQGLAQQRRSYEPGWL